MIFKTLTENNRFSKPVFLLCILFTFSSCLSQKQKQLLEEVEILAQELEDYKSLSEINFGVSSSEDATFDPSSSYNFESFTTEVSDTINRRKNLEDYFKEQKVYLDFSYPYNLIKIDKDASILYQLLGVDSFYFSDNPDLEPAYIPKKVNYLDGTAQEGENLITFSKKTIREKYVVTDEDGYEYFDSDKIDPFKEYIYLETDAYDHYIGIDSPKPIKSIQYEVHLPVKNPKTFKHLQQGDSISTSLGTVYIHHIENNRIFLEVPSDIDEDELQINALYKDGRFLQDRAFSMRPMFSKEKVKSFNNLLKTLTDAKQEIKNGNILTKEDLEKFIQQNISGYGDYYFTPTSYAWTITYAGPVHELFIRVSETEPEDLVFNINQEFYFEDKEYLLAHDFYKDSINSGIINKKGEWVVKPILTNAVRRINNYFFWDQMSFWDEKAHLSYDNTYWFDRNKQKLHLVDYKVFDYELYEDKYCIIETDTNGYKGVVNVLTGEIVIPLNNRYVRYIDGKWEYEQAFPVGPVGP